MNLENRQLVAIDATSADPRIVVVRPPQKLSKDDALTFAAHLVATANTALVSTGGRGVTPKAFGELVRATVKSDKKPSALVQLDATSGEVVILRAMASLDAHEAIALAGAVVATADPDANMLERVEAVVEANRGGKALAAILSKEGVEVKLGPPTRTRLDVQLEADELEADEAAEAMLKRMRR